jgi:hypothetical protein
VLLLPLLCAGDGLADVVGRRWGSRPLPHNKTKVGLGCGGTPLQHVAYNTHAIGVYCLSRGSSQLTQCSAAIL